jgi:hypothetical protein
LPMRDDLVVRAIEGLVRLLQDYRPKAKAPEPAPDELEPRALRQSERAGVDMNDMLRSIPKPKPPRKPSWER